MTCADATQHEIERLERHALLADEMAVASVSGSALKARMVEIAGKLREDAAVLLAEQLRASGGSLRPPPS